VTVSERPIFWIVAGPNGSGKSTLYKKTDIAAFGHSVWIINPDLLAARIHDGEAIPLEEAKGKAETNRQEGKRRSRTRRKCPARSCCRSKKN
jgi:predicted ABC-type ATPase